MIQVIYNNRSFMLGESQFAENNFHNQIKNVTGLLPSDYYLTQNGKRIANPGEQPFAILPGIPLRLQERLPGGKGGFGSMLRAIGAQIEKTTNREACRDLSGRRLRDINEEKRLKAYLDKQKESPADEAAKLQKKVDKLLAKPKHEFHDEEYNRARTDLTQNVGASVEEGFRKAVLAEKAAEGVKRKARATAAVGKDKKKPKKVKGGLWLGADDMGSSSDSDSDTGSDSACSSSGGASTSSSAKQTVTSEDDKSNSGKPAEQDEKAKESKQVAASEDGRCNPEEPIQQSETVSSKEKETCYQKSDDQEIEADKLAASG